MRHVVVTGANKGIGRAIARGVLGQHDDTFLWLGSRDAERGRAALEAISGGDASVAARGAVLPLDVASDASVAKAARTVEAKLAGERLYGVVNNAGVGRRGNDLRRVLEVNSVGVRRVCEAFLPLLDPERGRVVNVTSASGPSFVAKCSEARQRFFLDVETDWPQLAALIEECVPLEGDTAAFEARGLSDGDAYGLSKAIANTYTQRLAEEHPALTINACTPGFIETDMTRPYAEAQDTTPEKMGMKAPADGARCPLFLLFGEPQGSGHYYGSDAKRSPFDRYRSPGDPPYSGD